MTADLRLPPVIGHRGAAALAPENTLASIRAAAAAGARMVEVDAKLTADGVPILMHDDDLDHTTSGHGPVARRTAAEIARLDAGSWFAAAFAGEPVPTLADALDLVGALGLALNLEIKPCPGREEETARTVLGIARARWAVDRPPPLVSSFSVAAMRVAARQEPDWPRGYLIWDRPADWRRAAAEIGAATLNVSPDRCSAADLSDYLADGRPVLAFTVNDAAEAQRLWAAGVTAIFTDDPGALSGLMPRRTSAAAAQHAP